MSENNNKVTACRFIENAWNRRDMNILNQLIAPDHVSHGPFTEQFPQGAEGAMAFVTAFLGAFPDAHTTILNQDASGERVVTTVMFKGTQTGALMDIPATGKPVVVPVVVTDRIVGGKIVETWSEWKPESMFRQLGVKQKSEV